MVSYRNQNSEVDLQYNIKCLTDTMRSNGIVPALLVFGSMSTFSKESKRIRTNSEGMEDVKGGRDQIKILERSTNLPNNLPK